MNKKNLEQARIELCNVSCYTNKPIQKCATCFRYALICDVAKRKALTDKILRENTMTIYPPLAGVFEYPNGYVLTDYFENDFHFKKKRGICTLIGKDVAGGAKRMKELCARNGIDPKPLKILAPFKQYYLEDYWIIADSNNVHYFFQKSDDDYLFHFVKKEQH